MGHTSGFTTPARCPRWGHGSYARGVPHPPPCSGYRIGHITEEEMTLKGMLDTLERSGREALVADLKDVGGLKAGQRARIVDCLMLSVTPYYW